MVKFGKTEIAEKKFYIAKSPTEIWDGNVDNIVIWKLVEQKTNSIWLDV